MSSLYFKAEWCSVCKIVLPIIERLQKEGYDIQIIDSDKEANLSKQYNISSLPTTIIIKDKKEIKRFIGKITVNELRNYLTKKVLEYQIW